MPLGSTLASSWISMNLCISAAAEGGPGSACSTPCSPKASTVGGAGPRFDWKTPRSPKTSMLMGVAAAFLLMGVAAALMLMGVAELFLLGVFEGVLFWVRDGDLGTVRLGDLAGPPSEEGTFGDVSAPRMARVSRWPGLCMGRARAAIDVPRSSSICLNAQGLRRRGKNKLNAASLVP